MATVQKKFGRPKGISQSVNSDRRYRETRTPLDCTATLPAQIVPPGGHRVTTAPVDENAFRPGRVTQRKDPRSFLLSHTGIGGNNTRATATRVHRPVSDKVTSSPPKAGAWKRRSNPPNTELRRYYERGDLPCVIDQRGVHNKLAWKIEIPRLDFHHYLPIFFDGLREEEHPYRFIAREGVMDLLEHGNELILPVVPQLIIPLKNALNTRNAEIVSFVCRVLQKLVVADARTSQAGMIGRALVPYYRQLLPMLNLFSGRNKNTGDEFDYGQRKQGVEVLGEIIQDTLHALERTGGEDAFVNIKYLIPTYEACLL